MRLVVNPAAGRGAGAAALEGLRRLAAQRQVRVGVTRAPAELVAEARQAALEGAERLLVAGGDGTFHLAIQGLAGTSCALGMIPLGTGNDLPAILGVPHELGAAFTLACEGSIRRIDLGTVTLPSTARGVAVGAPPATGMPPDSVAYAIYCGAGFDGEVTRRARRMRRLRGSLTYAVATLAALVRFVPPRLRVEHDGGVFEGEAMFAVAANGDRFGGGMRIAPEARVDDGLLDLVVVERVSRGTFLRLFPRVYRGGHLGHPAVRHVSSRRIRLSADRPTPLTADGEPLGLAGRAPVEAAVWPAALAVATSRER